VPAQKRARLPRRQDFAQVLRSPAAAIAGYHRAREDPISAPTFSFGLPPSLGREPVLELAREFANILFEAGVTTVVPF